MYIYFHRQITRAKWQNEPYFWLQINLSTYLSILIRLSNNFKLESTSLSHVDMILLSMSVANIWLSKKRLRNGRWCCCWSDKNDALSKFCNDSRLVSHSFLSWFGMITKFSYAANIWTKRFRNISRMELFNLRSSQYCSCGLSGPLRVFGITSLLQLSTSSNATPLRRTMSTMRWNASDRGGVLPIESRPFPPPPLFDGCRSAIVSGGVLGRSQSRTSCNECLRLACMPDGRVQLDVITSFAISGRWVRKLFALRMAGWSLPGLPRSTLNLSSAAVISVMKSVRCGITGNSSGSWMVFLSISTQHRVASLPIFK